MHALLKSQTLDPVILNKLQQQDMGFNCTVGLNKHLRSKILYSHVSGFDWKWGGRKEAIKYLDRDSIEYSLSQAAAYDENERKMALRTLVNGIKLLDKDGGIFQFSTQADWQHPFPSKPVSAQTGCLRLYALAYALFYDHRFFNVAKSICQYLHKIQRQHPSYQSKAGYNYTHHVRDTGWSIEALAACYEFTGIKLGLSCAIDLVNTLQQQHSNNEGGYHAADGQYYLADNLAMARAMLQLYRVTMSKAFLHHAAKTANFIATAFYQPNAGFINIKGSLTPRLQIDENICISRFFNLLSYFTQNKHYMELAKHGMKYLSINEVATARECENGILLLDEELSLPPTEITIHGKQQCPQAKMLYRTALQSYGWYKVLKQSTMPEQTKSYATISKGDNHSNQIKDGKELNWCIRNM